KAGLKGRGWGGDVAVCDYDSDGYPDVLITNMFGPSQLYHNNGDGTFTDVTQQTLGRTSFGCIGVKAFDFNKDGRLDLLLADMHSDMWMNLDSEHRSRSLALEGQKKKYEHVSGPFGELMPERAKLQDEGTADELGFRLAEVVFGNTMFKNLG